ncbi:MAG: acyl-CoA dehydrogenase family protein [Minwuia sp.]|uniref:acyl-CoA dehydrogenase family protein n=1 Tax=Minwuia sp. TaxID=2493630 RepID=UPI003A877291
MNLDFSDEQKQLQDHIRRFLTDKCGSDVVRKVLDGDAPFDRELLQGLGELGVLGAAIPEEYGGSGMGPLELCLVAEELGRAVAPAPVSSSIYLAAGFLMEAGSEDQKKAWLPKMCTGETVGTFAHAEKPGRVTPRTVSASLDGGRLNGTKIAVNDGAGADMAVVSVREGDGFGLCIVDLNGEGVTREAMDSIDPSRKQARLVFDNAPAEKLDAGNAGTIEAVFDKAAIYIGFEQLGGADKALEAATEYAKERMAFGRQIGSFQAVKHMCADMYVSATLARSNAYWGAWAVSTGSSDLSVAAATVRVASTQAYQHCARNNIQVHGGMGFTWAFDCHLHYRRSNALALAIGAQSQWEDRLIEQMRLANASAAA